MINRIDLFMPPFSQYEVLHYITREIYEAVKRTETDCSLLTPEYNNPAPFLEKLFSDSPACTFSLNGLLPDKEGRFLCDMIKIPHIACLLDSPNQFAGLIASKRNIITCPDLYAVQFFKGLNFENVLFFPHAASKNLAPNPQLEKKYDVVFLGSCIDYEAIHESWKEKYPKRLRNTLEEAAELTLSDQTTPYVEAFVQALSNNIPTNEPLDPNTFHLMQILDDLEMFIRGKDRVELIKGIKDAQVHIFGEGKTGGGWKKYFGKDHPNVTLHDSVTIDSALNIMKESKIILNSCPWIKHGGHERIFSGLACGALVITSDNPYMAENFDDGEDIVFYQHNKWSEVNEIINTYLKDDSKRREIAEKGRQKVKEHHTWDHRVQSLLGQLPSILSKL